MNCLACVAVAQSASSGTGTPVAPFVFAALAATGLLGIWALRKRLSRKRTEALANTAIEMGFTFGGDDWPDKGRAPLLETPVFSKGHSHEVRNIMIGDRAGFKVSLFDYSFAEGRGKGQRTYSQTVASFSTDRTSLPCFELRPAKLMDKIWNPVDLNNVQLSANPGFAHRYNLRGALPEKVRALFAPRLVSFLDGLDAGKEWHIEGTANTLVVYRADKKTPPEQMRGFLEQTSQIATTFFSFAGVAEAANTVS